MSTPISYIVPFPKLDYSKQSFAVPNTKVPGQTAHYRNAAFGLIDTNTPKTLTTLPQVFEAGLALAGPNAPLLGHRPITTKSPLTFGPYVWQTYGEVDQRRRNLGSALQGLFQSGVLGGGDMDTVGIWSHNTPEWQVIDLACQAYAKVAVSLYDTLGKDSVGYIVEHSHLTVVFTTAEHIPMLLQLSKSLPVLKLIVSIDQLSVESAKILSTWAQTVDVRVTDLQTLEATGKMNPLPTIAATPDQVASICYTSGTTGNPKGVILTNGNLAMTVQTTLYGQNVPDREVVTLSYLPLAHIYGRMAELASIAAGGRIGYFTNDPLRLLADAQALRPNTFPSVPRVLNRVYQAAMIAAKAPGLKGALFRKGMEVKLQRLHETGETTHAFWDKLIFNKIHALLGGNLKLVASGSAPISPEVLDFLKIAFSCDVIEGCGMTETSATTCRCWPNDPTSAGCIGPPQPVNEVKLIDVAAMGYTSEDKPNPRGEICVRGANCFQQYYKDEKNTKETVDADGWVHTGDVGEIDSCGRFKIVDRVKNIMKLAQGEYVALEKIENTYSTSPIISQLYVHGDSLQSYLVAVIVPDTVQFSALASKALHKHIRPEDTAALQAACKEEKVVKAVIALLDREAKRNALKGFEKIKAIVLSMEPFSVENGAMTPTFKIQRKYAAKMHEEAIAALFALPEPSSSRL